MLNALLPKPKCVHVGRFGSGALCFPHKPSKHDQNHVTPLPTTLHLQKTCIDAFSSHFFDKQPWLAYIMMPSIALVPGLFVGWASATILKLSDSVQNATHAWKLHCKVREYLLPVIQNKYPDALPKLRRMDAEEV